MMNSSPQSPNKWPTKLGLLLTAPVIALLASCATPTGPIAHRHGDLIHSHVIGPGHAHAHSSLENIEKSSPSNINTVKLEATPAQASAIRPMGIGHKHHSHTDPATGESTAPC